MNIGDTSGVKDEKKMDSNKVWHWRIMHAKKYSISPEPFHYSNEIGLTFDVASNTQKKLDLDLLTNGVILEVCDFAKTVIKGKGRFITQILENNFDLRLENEQQRVDFTAQILHKVKDLIRKPPENKREVFMLFDKPSNLECTNNSNNGLHMACTEGKTGSFAVETDITDDSEEEDGFNYSQATSKEYMTENLSDFESDESKQKCSGQQAATELKVVLPFSFPYCEEIGLCFDNGSIQSLDIGLLTKGVMLELVHFTRVLTASYNRIILDVLEHNFELDLKDEQVKNQVLLKVSHLLKRRKQLGITGNKGEFKNEPFAFQTNTEGDHSDSYAQEESALDSDKQGHLKHPKYTDVPRESESSCLTTTDISSTLSIVNTIVNPPFESQPDKRGFCGDEEETQTPRSGLNKSDIEQEEMGIEHNMWKLRSKRVEQILSPLTKDFGQFNRSKRVGLEYNVGFGPKQNISVESLKDPLLLEIGTFAVAMNLSQKDFIMEILEYNFDLNLPSQHHRNIFASDIISRVRQLRSCGDAVKFSNEVFELPSPSINMTAQSVDGVSPELTSRSRMEEFDVSPVCPPDSHAETKEHISYRSGDLYPLCKEMGLNLHVNNNQPNKKLEINKLTNGAMTEVANFAEKLCGTFEQICLDILRHNLDFDLQRDSELAKNIFARISALKEQRNLSAFPKMCKNIKLMMNDMSTMENLDCPDNPNLNTCSVSSSQAAVIDQNVCSSADAKHRNDLDLNMWKLRANHIQQILHSMPHREYCPFYFYSRCRKLGIDFNVGSGIKQNLDPKFLTNGIMAELNSFATALLSAQKYFIIEILEHNFDLNFENELSRSAFGDQVMGKIQKWGMLKRRLIRRRSLMKKRFELPDVRCIDEPSYGKTLRCPKCYQDQKFHEDESDPCHMHQPRPHTMSDTVSADVKCTIQKRAKDASSVFSTAEKTIMDSLPHCKKIGLNLCIDKDLPKDKLDMHVLTNSVMMEVYQFAKRLCGTNNVLMNDVLKHNFNLGKESLDLNPAELFYRERSRNDGGPAWYNKVFDIQSYSSRPPGRISKARQEFALRRSERMEIIKERQLVLQTKQEKANMASGSGENPYPACTVIGLDLDMKEESGKKVKLDLKLLTRAVVFEIHKFATLEAVNYYPRILFDILDYNFDLSSQHYRRWEFSIATALKIQTMVKECCKKDDNTEDVDEIFKLPFIFDPETSQNVEKKQNIKCTHSSTDTATESNSSCVDIHTHFLTSANMLSSLPTVNSNVTSKIGNQPDERGFYGDEEQTQTPRNAPNDCDMEQEEVRTENYYTCPLGESDLESDEVSDSENTGKRNHLQNPQSFSPGSHIVSELESSCMGIHARFFTSINHQYDIEQEEIGTEHNMWKLRSNRVEQILFALTKDFSRFSWSKRVGLEYNVGFGPKQNIGVESLKDPLLLEIGTFAVAMNLSQKDFIMEILEYNFDLNLPSQHHRNIFASDIISRVGQLRSCGDAVKFSNEVFELPGLVASINMTAESECDVAPVCPPDSQAESKEHISCRSGDLYPLCKEIGLNLYVSNSQPNKKLEINKLTNGAMTELTNFAEKLCGTFEQICLDILRHNLDFDLQRDSEIAKNIFARISALKEKMNLPFPKTYKNIKLMMNDMSTMEKQDCPDDPNLHTCSAGSSQAAVIDQNVCSSAYTEHQNDLDLKMWILRANHIQRILSMPHKEHCSHYSYSRCKKLGIDFNVGSGIKQNLDPKFLTNGIMVELNTFATALSSAQKHFITEILEHNFDLNFENELSRSAFAGELLSKIKCKKLSKMSFSSRQHYMEKPFQLPPVRCIEPSYGKTRHCSKCYQDQKFHEDESDPCHRHQLRPHTMSDTVSADVKCTTQKYAKNASSVFLTTEQTIMDSNPHCKKIGLNLCVDKDLPRDKLDMHVLTNSVMKEVVQFARKICGTLSVIIYDVLEHNFNISMLDYHLYPAEILASGMQKKVTDPDWLNKVFVLNRTRQLKQTPVRQKSNCLESIRKRQLALQTKQERANMPSGSGENPYPACTVIGLDLDVTSKSGEKVILDLKLLTRAVVLEIHKFATLEAVNYYSRTVFDILDYNFDLSSQHYRRWEFSIATALKFQTMVKECCKKDDNTEDVDEIFKLPFIFDPETSQNVEKKQNIKGTNSSMDTATESNSSCVDIHTHFLTSANMLSSLPTVNSNVTSKIGNQPDERGFYGDEEQTQTPRNAPNDCDMEQEEVRTENYYTCPLGESDLESDEVSDSENTGKQNHLQNPQSFFPSSHIVSELKSSCMGIHARFFTSINHQSDIEQEEMGTEHNMWKLRSNRVEQILSALTKDFGQFNRSKRVGLEYNVGFGPKQNIRVESLKDSLLFEIGKFTLAMNSSQKDFIMEILEYNFDLNLPSQHHRNIFASDIMTRVRQLRSCGDAVKFSNEVFELPGLVASINMTAESEGGVNPELSMSKMGKCDVSPVCPPDSQAESKEHISCRSGDLYPLCKEMGLNLYVNNSQPNKKLEINKLTNGAMAEVANFADKLCGTFEQICLDILRHNLDFDLQRDSEFAKNILAKIPILIVRRNLLPFSKSHKNMKHTMNDMSTMEKQDCPDNLNLDTCRAGSSHAAVIDQNVCSFADTEHLNDLDLKMWKLRANHIQRILSMPHREYCPFYSYSRCRKLGIDFNVGSGVKQYLDPKLLTNGIMVELHTFATELYSAQKHFVIEVLEYNFELNFENELSRSAFAKQIMTRKGQWKINCLPFELPDARCIQEPICGNSLPCPKCYQDQNYEVLKDKSDPVHMHPPQPSTMTGTHSTDVNCAAPQPTEDPSSTVFTLEEMIMEGYPLCKEIGLNLCVDKDKPKNKLDARVLTYGILNELTSFARKLCGAKSKVVIDVLKHNFKIGILHQHLNPAEIHISVTQKKVSDPDWFNEVFVLNRPRQLKRAPAIQKSNCMESIKKRRLALQLSQSQGQSQDQGQSVIESKPNYSICYPLCSEIGLDLDVTSKSEEKEKLDLKLLTTAVVAEIHKYASSKSRHYFPRTVFDILDYNFDLTSQHHRRLEFSIATASKLQSIAKRYRKNRDRPDEVFKLPFVFEKKKEEKMKCKKYSQEKPVKKRSSYVHQIGHHSDVSDINLVTGVQTEEDPCSHNENTKSSKDHWMTKIQNPGLVSVGCGSPLQENTQIKKEEYYSHYDKPELDTEEKYHPQHVDVKNESVIGGVEHSMPYESPGSLGNSVHQDHLENPTSPDIPSESESRLLVGCATFPTPIDVSSTLSANIQNPGLVSVGYDPHYVKQEPDTEEIYHTQHVDVKAESNICDAEQFIPCEPAGSHGYAGISPHPNSESNINTESENECFTESHMQIELDTSGINLIIIDESYENVFI